MISSPYRVESGADVAKNILKGLAGRLDLAYMNGRGERRYRGIIFKDFRQLAQNASGIFQGAKSVFAGKD